MTGTIPDFRTALLAWYSENARDLPWRRTHDPYVVWISEVMLQQTRVAAVVEYFTRFIEAFPTIEALAEAPESSVLALWSGLGYYRRARMLHEAARRVVIEHGGRMPKTAARLRELPGIGEYTAAAVASISFGEAVPVVDGNVERVLLRLHGPRLTQPKAAKGTQSVRVFRAAALELLDRKKPGDFNQAMMELGATVCLPRSPLCGECPVRLHCRTQGEHATAPAKPMRSREAAYALLLKRRGPEAMVLLRRRSKSEPQMPDMWELPAAPEEGLPEDSAILTVRHAITNTNYTVTVHAMPAKEKPTLQAPRGSLHWVHVQDLHTLPLTGLARKVLKRVKILSGPGKGGFR